MSVRTEGCYNLRPGHSSILQQQQLKNQTAYVVTKRYRRDGHNGARNMLSLT